MVESIDDGSLPVEAEEVEDAVELGTAAIAADVEEAPLPPPPPTDCAKMPAELAPVAEIAAELMTVTIAPAPPSPPMPPRPMDSAITPPVEALVAEEPPLPPPPPTAWAKIPGAWAPEVVMVPLLSTFTAEALPPAPAQPPMLSEPA